MNRLIPLLALPGAAWLAGCADLPPPAAPAPKNPVPPPARAVAATPRPVETGPAWSNPAMTEIGPERRPAHGKFRAEPVSVTAAHLPEHTRVKVKFTLTMLGSWDGSNVAWGPDLWALRVRGGEQLYLTSFSNLGACTSCYIQAFPDDYPWVTHYAFTGAKPLSGKPFAEPDPQTFAAIADAVYAIEVNFPHRGDSLTLDFQSLYTDPATDSQCWAVSDLEIIPAAEPLPLDDTELAHLWEEMAAPDSVRANAAMWRLLAGGDRACSFLIGQAASVPDRGCGDTETTPTDLRLYRAQKALRIFGTPESRAAGDNLTCKVPAYATPSPAVTE